MQKTLLKNFPTLSPQEWSIQIKNDCLIVTNNFTIDEFAFQKLNINSWHLHEIYKARSQYSIPNTPQLMVGSHQRDRNIMEILVQLAPFKIDRLLRRNTCECSIQELIKTVLKTIQILVKKFGFFRITPKMLGVTRSNNFIVWIHQKFIQTHSQYPLISSNIYDDYKAMINDILSLFQLAGCKNQLQNIKLKVNQQKIMSFEKFKVILENNLKCHQKQKQRSQKITYRSPQFLKKKTSPDNARRVTTQIFFDDHYPKKQNRFLASDNFPISKSNNQLKKQQFQQLEFLQNKKTLSNDPSIKNICYLKNQSGISRFCSSQRGSASYQKSPTAEHCHEYTEKNRKFRQSGNSVSTTAFMTSITSSGKIKLNSQENNLLNTPTREQKKSLVSSVGVKQSQKLMEIKDMFRVKASKIIQQKYEQQALNPAHSMIKAQNTSERLQVSYDYEKQIDGLLRSEVESSFQRTSQINDLETEISNILTG